VRESLGAVETIAKDLVDEPDDERRDKRANDHPPSCPSSSRAPRRPLHPASAIVLVERGDEAENAAFPTLAAQFPNKPPATRTCRSLESLVMR
jgi:hypothetical protein